jgi:hypothetical protein
MIYYGSVWKLGPVLVETEPRTFLCILEAALGCSHVGVNGVGEGILNAESALFD